MIGELKSKETRTVHGDIVIRLTVDIGFKDAEKRLVGESDLLAYLDHNVGNDIMLNIEALEDKDQLRLHEAQRKRDANR